MTPEEFRHLIGNLSEHAPITEALERQQRTGAGYGAWYRSQKEHWLGWLGEYGGPGAYGRQSWDRDARFIYNHFQCAPGLLWLTEAVKLKAATLAGRDAILSAGGRPATQCAAFRRAVPWEVLEEALKLKRS